MQYCLIDTAEFSIKENIRSKISSLTGKKESKTEERYPYNNDQTRKAYAKVGGYVGAAGGALAGGAGLGMLARKLGKQQQDELEGDLSKVFIDDDARDVLKNQLRNVKIARKAAIPVLAGAGLAGGLVAGRQIGKTVGNIRNLMKDPEKQQTYYDKGLTRAERKGGIKYGIGTGLAGALTGAVGGGGLTYQLTGAGSPKALLAGAGIGALTGGLAGMNLGMSKNKNKYNKRYIEEVVRKPKEK